MSKLSAHYLSPLCCIVLLIFGFTSHCLAQEASNKRGFQPGNSFAIGDFETINTTNGNLMLRFPLGALPAGRNGLTAGINLYYNSKLYDSETAYFLNENESCEIVGSEPGILVCPYHQKSVLKESPEGGWHLGMGYSIDGSFMRLDVAHDNDTEPMNNPWTLYGEITGSFRP